MSRLHNSSWLLIIQEQKIMKYDNNDSNLICIIGGSQIWKAHTGHDSGCAVGTQILSVEKVSVCTAGRHWSSFVHVQGRQV